MRTKALILALAAATACTRSTPSANEVVAVKTAALPSAPADSGWSAAPEYTAKLLLQDLVDPRLMTPSTQEVRVRALTDGAHLALRLSWADAAVNDLPGPGRFLDGCAIQIPRAIESNPPDPQMGQAGRTVDIAFWRADWQASMNGRKDEIRSLYPNAAVDHYPFEAKSLAPGSAAQREMASRYAPAQAVGNRRVGPREFPVEDMIAEGPGTLSPNPGGGSRGRGERTEGGWSVLIVRKAPEGWEPKTRTQIAFAVWQGSAKEAGGRKMRTGWVPLSMKETAP
ncbi:MAG: ethylbenzene dehydrogenase-related protein [Bryobacteraceae bacterium]